MKPWVQVNLVLVQVLIELLRAQDFGNAHQLCVRGRERGGGGRGEERVQSRKDGKDASRGLPQVGPSASTPHLVIVVVPMKKGFFLENLWRARQVVAVKTFTAQGGWKHCPLTMLASMQPKLQRSSE